MLLLLLPLLRVPRTHGEERKERKEGKEKGGEKRGRGIEMEVDRKEGKMKREVTQRKEHL